jgi:pimeloyl-ACP methyl ester carboxylesterase
MVVGPVLPRRSHLGLVFGEQPPDAPHVPGAVIRVVRPGSPALEAGVLAGDRLTHVDGSPVESADQARRALGGSGSGARRTLTMLREGSLLSLTLVAQPLPLEGFSGARVQLEHVSAAGHRLRAIAVIPDGTGPHPVVYYLPGAHWSSEEHPFDPDHPVTALVGALAAAGFASLRVERSGVGDSEGPPCADVDFETELEGYRAGLGLLDEVSWAAPAQRFLFGHSLGGIVAPLLASSRPVSGVAVFGTTFGRFSDSLIGAARRRSELVRASGDDLRAHLEALPEIIRAVVGDGLSPDELYARRPELASVGQRWYAGTRAFGRTVRFYQQIERLDLAQRWRDVRAPVLAVHGTDDWVASSEDARQIADRVGSGARHVELAGVDHFMCTSEPGCPPRLAQSLVATLVTWLAEAQTSTGSGGHTVP